MNFYRLTEIIEEGEGLNVEFKRKVSSPERIAKEMIAFANTSGGVILFGIDDDKQIVGVESEKGEIEFITLAATQHTDPEIPLNIKIFSIENRDVVCVEINESKTKPHFLIDAKEDDDKSPRAYIRVGENSVLASKEMVKVMYHQAGRDGPVHIIIGEPERRLFAYLEENERITVKEYAHLINVSERRASRLLVRLVRAGSLAIHTMEKYDYYTLMHEQINQ